ncbi:MAG: hypothetical protein H0S80_08880 [Desulfovibrionaceae bacterium]|nr:hypothetical protein [Desulfovibrionaceae bacterium]
MGSPSARLNTREDLRTWVESGLEFLYLPGGVRVEAENGPPAQGASPAQSVPHPPSPSYPPERRQAVAPKGAPGPRPASTSRPAMPPTPTPAPDFPRPWDHFLKFTKPGAKVVWTYMELGLDLGGQPDHRRSEVLKNLQAHLRWPKGTINFWPVSALADGALQPDTNLFWKGWELWRTPHIACFGEEALRVILPQADPSLSTHMLEHVIVHVLPPLGRLTALLPHEQQMAVDDLLKIRL